MLRLTYEKHAFHRLWFQCIGYERNALYDSDFAKFEFSWADTVSLDNVKGLVTFSNGATHATAEKASLVRARFW